MYCPLDILGSNISCIFICYLPKAKEIEMEHLQRHLAEKDRVIQDARTSEEEAKVSHIAVNAISPSLC